MVKRNTLCYFFIICTVCLHTLEIPLRIIDGDLDIPLEGVCVSLQNIPQPEVLTDVNGTVDLFISDDTQFPLSIICSTPGYTYTKTELKSAIVSYTKEKPLVIVMGLDTVLEGEELVVEGSREGKTDQKSGVSIVRTSEDMETTAQIGVVADVMNAVSLLPGVGFKMGMNMEPSIRGGYPAEMGVTFDGVYLLEPFYWDGMVSILSPYMVDTLKLSTGIFSSRYGQGTSGLLDSMSVKIGDAKKLTINISTISADVAAELSLGEKNDLFLYAHLTDLTTVKWLIQGMMALYDLSEHKYDFFDTMRWGLPALIYMPHIYSLYSKWDYHPAPEFSLTTNILFAYDGMQFKLTEGSGDSLVQIGSGDYLNYSLYPPYGSINQFIYDDFQGVTSIHFDWLISNSLLLHGQGSYTNHVSIKNNHQYDLIQFGHYVIVYDENGNPMYDENGNVIMEFATSYIQDDLVTKVTSFKQQIQGKTYIEWQMLDDSFLNFGLEEVYDMTQIGREEAGYEMYNVTDEILEYAPYSGGYYSIISSVPGNNILNTCAFALWDFGSDTSVLQGELGVRGEHFYLWNKDAHFDLNNYPVVNPRANIIYTPFRNTGIFDSVSFSAGSGLYSALSQEASEIEKSAVTDIFTLTPNTAWTSVIGTDVSFSSGIHITLEGYYKHYLTRTYVYADERDGQNILYHAGNDGKGFATGADFMIEKSINGWIDGYISYSFLYARFYNPVIAQYDSQTTTTGDPLGILYYPEYHRFHTVNAVLNFRLPKNCTITLTDSFATGNLMKQYIYKGDEYLAGTYKDPGLNEYMYLTLYSDTLRSIPDWAMDIRFSKSGTFRNPKHTWEWYFGVENLFGLFYGNYKTSYMKELNGFYKSTGWTIGERGYTIDMGLCPIPSFGVKMTF